MHRHHHDDDCRHGGHPRVRHRRHRRRAPDKEVIDKAIAEAVEDAKKDGIHGKATTPYLLAKIKDLTGGDSLDSNIQLVFNNARLGAAAAVELSKLEK